MKTKETGTTSNMSGENKYELKSAGEVKSGVDSSRSKSDGDKDVGAVCRSLSLRFTDTLPVQLQVLNSRPSTTRRDSDQCTLLLLMWYSTVCSVTHCTLMVARVNRAVHREINRTQ